MANQKAVVWTADELAAGSVIRINPIDTKDNEAALASKEVRQAALALAIQFGVPGDNNDIYRMTNLQNTARQFVNWIERANFD